MNSTLNNVLIFVTGVAIGSAITWKLLDTKYEMLMSEESESIKTELKRLYGIETKSETEDKQDTEQQTADIREYAAKLAEQRYTDYTDITTLEKKEVAKVKPYIIEPERYGEIYEYDTISLTYYADGVLADDSDEKIEDVDEIVGADSLEHFGEYEEDCVFVRNDELKCDYEILRDYRKYSDVVGETRPNQMEE